MCKKSQKEASLEKARCRCKVWGEKERWEPEREKSPKERKERKEGRATYIGRRQKWEEERNRRKRWKAKPTLQDDLPDREQRM